MAKKAAVKKAITYSVSLYEKEKNKIADSVESGFAKKSIALAHAKMYLRSGEFNLAKVQSSDKEFNEVLTSKTTKPMANKAAVKKPASKKVRKLAKEDFYEIIKHVYESALIVHVPSTKDVNKSGGYKLTDEQLKEIIEVVIYAKDDLDRDFMDYVMAQEHKLKFIRLTDDQPEFAEPDTEFGN